MCPVVSHVGGSARVLIAHVHTFWFRFHGWAGGRGGLAQPNRTVSRADAICECCAARLRGVDWAKSATARRRLARRRQAPPEKRKRRTVTRWPYGYRVTRSVELKTKRRVCAGRARVYWYGTSRRLKYVLGLLYGGIDVDVQVLSPARRVFEICYTRPKS